MREPLTIEDFSPHIGRVFSVAGREDRLTLVATENGRAPRGSARQPFILFFQSPRDRLLPEGAYTVEAEDSGPFDLYIIPIITPPGAEQDYQVIFN
ncbi:MAG TPA: hypothetical protein VGV37_08400 [Aliidongia sp.]|uniref:DUF6916 family protein n=1 Tax=Aliidongia sp. TaxID=1914230 RepID=UPI002DDC9F7F|nr:hypothetical protein [Aliidongia sp.]HEV2674547.1 hypothetical protein [Aliidongia sp.]